MGKSMAKITQKAKSIPKGQVTNEEGWYGKLEDKPPTEQQLFKLQDELFATRDAYREAFAEWQQENCRAYKEGRANTTPKPIDHSRAVYSEMLGILFNYIKSVVLKRNKGKAFKEPDEIDDIAMSATIMFMNQYNKKDTFKVGASFAGMFGWKITEASAKNDVEKYHISLNKVLGNDTDTEFGEAQFKNGFNNFMSPLEENASPESIYMASIATNVVAEVLEELDEQLGKDSRLAFLARLYMTIVIRYPKTRHIKRIFLEKWCTDHKTQQVIEACELELYNRLVKLTYSD